MGRLTRLATVVAVGLLTLALVGSSAARDRPFGTSKLHLDKLYYNDLLAGGAGFAGITDAGGQFSKVQIERFRCTSGGNPAATVDISCNTTEYGQNFAPDNEIAIAVNPTNPNHLVAGSNDYFYRFNNATGARQAIIPTGFFTSFNGGASWVDGQIPMQSGNGAGDPAPAFDRAHGTVLMAQLENTGGQGGANIAQGDVSVSYSTDGGLNWSEPVRVMHGVGAAGVSKFYDKEWLTCNNYPGTVAYGRCYLTATLFSSGQHGSYLSSDIFISWSDDGGRTWTQPRSIGVTHPTCTYQETGGATSRACDENQFSIPEVASNGRLYIHFANSQNTALFETPFDFDTQIMVIRSDNGGQTFGPATIAAQLEDGLSDMPYSVIQRQTVWGHQIRWNAIGNISVNPLNPNDVTVVFADRGTANPNATTDTKGTADPNDDVPCFIRESTGGLKLDAPYYDPCNAGPGSDTNVYMVRSTDGGLTWGPRTALQPGFLLHEWFPWADHKPDGTLAVGWDRDDQTATPSGDIVTHGTGANAVQVNVPANDTFHHVLSVGGGAPMLLGAPERVDVSVTHWSGQYVPPSLWPVVCGPVGYMDPPYSGPARGKDCNVFHGDYTGLATGSDGSINVVWTGLNQLVTSPQIDPYTGGLHDGYRQDAMFARR